MPFYLEVDSFIARILLSYETNYRLHVISLVLLQHEQLILTKMAVPFHADVAGFFIYLFLVWNVFKLFQLVGDVLDLVQGDGEALDQVGHHGITLTCPIWKFFL